MESTLHLLLDWPPREAPGGFEPFWSDPVRGRYTAFLTPTEVAEAAAQGLATLDIHDPVIALAGWVGHVRELEHQGGEASDLRVFVYDRPTADILFHDVELVESLAVNVALVRASDDGWSGVEPLATYPVPRALLVARMLREAAVGATERRVRVAAMGDGTFQGAPSAPFGDWGAGALTIGDGHTLARGLVPLAGLDKFAATPGLLGLTPELAFSGASGGVDRANDLNAPATWPAVGGAGEAVMILDGGYEVDGAIAPFVKASVAATAQLPYWNGYIDGITRLEALTTATDETGHATMVAAVIAGRRPADWVDLGAGNDPHGIAPEAKVVLVSLGRNRRPGAPLPGTVAQFDDMVSGTDAPPRLVVDEVGITTALSEGQSQGVKVRIGCMAFERGFPATDTGYDATCAELDTFVYRNPATLLVAAAGNIRDEADVGPIRAPGAAKNVLTVGAFAATEGDIESGRKEKTDNARGTTTWSRSGAASHAPGAGSIGAKPDVVAPGANVLSYRSSATRVWDAGAVPAVAREDYAFFNGSSVACAVTAGVVANVRSRLVQSWDGVEPSAAALKALFILGAAAPEAPKPLAVTPAVARMRVAATPNETKGWGRVDVRRMLVAASGPSVKVLDGAVVGRTPLVIRLGSGIFQGERPVIAALAWTDRPSLCLGGGWVAQYAMTLIGVRGGARRCLAQPYVTGAQIVAASIDPDDGAYELHVHALTAEAVGGVVAVALSGANPTDADQGWRTA